MTTEVVLGFVVVALLIQRWFDQRALMKLEARLADSVTQETLIAAMDRMLSRNPAEQAARLKATRKEASGLQPVEPADTSREKDEKPRKRKQPRSHSHIPQLSSFETIRLVDGIAVCYPYADGHASVKRIPEESYWRLVEAHAEDET